MVETGRRDMRGAGSLALSFHNLRPNADKATVYIVHHINLPTPNLLYKKPIKTRHNKGLLMVYGFCFVYGLQWSESMHTLGVDKRSQ
jgi:hypothetical protein